VVKCCFTTVPFYLCVYPLTQNDQMGHHVPAPGEEPKRSLISGFSSMTTPFNAERARFGKITHMGGDVSWSQPPLPSQEGGYTAISNFGVLLYLCLHPSSENDWIRRGNTYVTGASLRRSAMHYITTGTWPQQTQGLGFSRTRLDVERRNSTW